MHGCQTCTICCTYATMVHGISRQSDIPSRYNVNHKERVAEYWLCLWCFAGRPVDILQLPDGSILISDDYASAVYRVTYGPSA
jgi:glucose/arabinose dehydrogenase